MEKIKEYLARVGLALLAILGIVIGIKFKRLQKLEAEKRIADLDKEVSGLRKEIDEHREDVNQKEKDLRIREAEYRDAVRRYRSDHGDKGNV